MPASDILKAEVKRLKLPAADETKVFSFIDGLVSDPTVVVSVDTMPYYVSQNTDIQTVFDNRFPGNKALRDAGKPEYSYGNYLTLEEEFRSDLRDAGFPPGFYDDTSSLGKFIGGEVSRAELQTRATAAYTAVKEADPGTVTELRRLYGLGDADLAAYFLDPAKAVDALNKRLTGRQLAGQVQAAQIGAEAQRQAGMGLTTQQAERLAQQGVSPETARQGFTAIAAQQQLFQPIGAGEQAVTAEEQIGATFGTNAAAAQRIAQRRRRRQAEFETGGGVATSQTGVSGLRTVGQ